MVVSGPALAVVSGFTSSPIKCDAAPQGPAGSSVVMVSVTTVPISPLPGVYTAPKSDESLNVPSPEVVHVTEDAEPPIEPLKV